MRILFFISFFIFAHLTFSQSNKNILLKYPKNVQQIILTEKGAFRGINFGETKETVKAKETLQIQSESDSSLVYTLNLNTEDSADLIYYFDESGKTKRFSIVFILDAGNEEQSLRTSITKFYNEKFGIYTIMNQKDELWDTKLGHLIEMHETSDEAAVEIEIDYFLR